ncbi:MAG TPA: YceI family protein [Thermoanaerobaculia bacterium]|jgi:polyisoprenoid-binding protein YceI|nr:YceI family protein [Thermoanaerobaculia bacterium]
MLRRSRSLVLFAAGIAAAAMLSAAETFTVDKNHSDASFRIRHFASKVRGRFADFEGTIQADPAKPEASSVAFTIKTASIDTSQPDRDKHLRSADFFDVEKYPEITFKSSKFTPAGKDKYDVTGTLTMHGVSKEITLPVTYLGTVKDPRGTERASFEIDTKLNRKDFGMTWNRALDAGGFMLSDDVDVEIALETVKKAPEADGAK